MSCDTLQDALVDVARGRDAGAGTVGAVEAHVEHCAACRARFAREVSLSDGLRALADAKASVGASPDVEAKLLAAFAAHDPRPAIREQRTVVRQLLPVAAAAGLVAAAGVAWWALSGSHSAQVQPAPTVAVKPVDQRVPPSPQTLQAMQSQVTTAQLQAEGKPSRRQQTTSRNDPAAGVIRPEGFVALPTALGLPAFESGEIVRVEVPVTSLPMYGIDIAPDASGPAVEADFLVGQDGQARAIRLVKNGRL